MRGHGGSYFEVPHQACIKADDVECVNARVGSYISEALGDFVEEQQVATGGDF